MDGLIFLIILVYVLGIFDWIPQTIREWLKIQREKLRLKEIELKNKL